MSEIVAPGGNLEKLRTAFAFGADAVYIGGTVFGLRKFADNFSLADTETAINLANQLNKRVFIVLNGFAQQEDLGPIKDYIMACSNLKPHAFIISDMGVFTLAQQYSSIPIHVSTQASVTNWLTASMWKKRGAKRVVVARELTIDECKRIKDKVDIELEVFVHGAMCASYSGKCVISNYTAGRDSNRGGCIQTCRHSFDISTPDQLDYTAHIMNAKDLNAITLIPKLIDAGIDSFKIEGRMKSNLYVANTVSNYRQVINNTLTKTTHTHHDTLDHVSNRGFNTGGLEKRPFSKSIQYSFGGYQKKRHYIGPVKAVFPEKSIFIQSKAPFKKGDTLDYLSQNHDWITINTDSIKSMSGTPLTETKPNSVVELPWTSGIQCLDIVSKSL